METIKIPLQHWIAYLFGRVGGVGVGGKKTDLYFKTKA